MPNGVPVATVALNAAKNAGLLAVQILAVSDKILAEKYLAYKEKMQQEVKEKATQLATEWRNEFDV
jgi:5-(carboxyamino)imidazole ribonucleotide mutase